MTTQNDHQFWISLEPFVGISQLAGAYELGRLWADLGSTFAELEAFLHKRVWYTRLNESLNGYFYLFERVFPNIRPARIAYLHRLWKCNYNDEAACSEIAAREKRLWEESGGGYDIDEVRLHLNHELLSSVNYRHKFMDRFLSAVFSKNSSAHAAFTLGVRVGECVFPKNLVIDLFCLHRRLGDRHHTFVISTKSWTSEERYFSSEGFTEVRDSIWLMQRERPHPEWESLSKATFDLVGTPIGPEGKNFLKLHDGIRRVLDQLGESAILDDSAAPMVSHQTDPHPDLGSCIEVAHDSKSSAPESDCPSTDKTTPIIGDSIRWNRYHLNGNTLSIMSIDEQSPIVASATFKNQNLELIRSMILNQGSRDISQLSTDLRLKQENMRWVQRIKRIVSEVNNALHKQIGIRRAMKPIECRSKTRPKWNPSAVLHLNPFQDLWLESDRNLINPQEFNAE